MKEYAFNYMTTKNVVSLDDINVNVKIGPIIKKNFLFGNIINFYVFNNNNTYHSLFITYTDEGGKSKKIQLYSSPGDWTFRALCDDLNARIPGKSLNHLSEADAFKAMKMANPKKWAPVVAFGIIFLVLTLLFYPGLRHFFDFGFESATITEITDGGGKGTRNLKLSGYPLDYGLEQTTTTTKRGSTTKSTSVYLPIVDENWQEGDPVKMILEFGKLSDAEYNDVLEQTEFTGVVRNVGWEGIGSDELKFFKETYSLNMQEKPILFEVTNKEHNDSMFFFIWILSLVIMLGVFIYMKLKNK